MVSEHVHGILSDDDISALCKDTQTPLISPLPTKSLPGEISYGLSSYGYDARLGEEIHLLDRVVGDGNNINVIDPKNFNSDITTTLKPDADGVVVIPPHGFVLGHTVETFHIPDDVLVVCLGKSTYARCFSGDTEVKIVGEEPMTFEELARHWTENKTFFFGRGIDEKTGQIKTVPLTAPRLVGEDNLYMVSFVDGTQIKVTGDHEWITHKSRTVTEHGVEQFYHTTRVVTTSLKPGSRVSTDGEGLIFLIVESVKEIPGEKQNVYCLTSKETGNFALGNGAFVSNCGLIVNVTPLEPGWSGQVTLEISNTTPLPAKIYVGEGICQFLFFRGEHTPSVTYAQKKGKYMNQTGVTHPRLAK